MIKISTFVAVSSSLRIVSMSIAGACRGSSLLSTVAAEIASGFVNGQSMPCASDQTVRACLAAAGTVRPRSTRDSR